MRTKSIILMGLFMIEFLGCEGYFNHSPVIEEISVNKTEVKPGDEVTINIVANDPDGDKLSYEYEVSGGTITGSGSMVRWTAPNEEGTYFINITVRDDSNWVRRSITISTSRTEGEKVTLNRNLSDARITIDEVKAFGGTALDALIKLLESHFEPGILKQAMKEAYGAKPGAPSLVFRQEQSDEQTIVEVKTYEVTGSNGDEVADSIGKNSPIVVDGKIYGGSTDGGKAHVGSIPEFTPWSKCEKKMDTCTCDCYMELTGIEFKTSFNVTITLPEWKVPDPPPSGNIKDGIEGWIAKLEDHERGHAEIIKKAIEDLNNELQQNEDLKEACDKLKGKKYPVKTATAEDCEKAKEEACKEALEEANKGFGEDYSKVLKPIIDPIKKAVEDSLNDAHEKYDRDTNHGSTQGADMQDLRKCK